MGEQRGSVAIVGAGDHIGAAIARRFAREGYAVHGGRRNVDKLQPLAEQIAAQAAGSPAMRSTPATKPRSMAFLDAADARAPLELVIFNVGANVQFPLLDTTERVFRKVWEMACLAGFLTGREAARRMLVARARLDLLHRRDRVDARRRGLCRFRRGQGRTARRWRSRWRASLGRRISMSRIW